MSSTTKARDYLRKAHRLHGEESPFGERRGLQLMREGFDALIDGAGSPVDCVRVQALALGLLVELARDGGVEPALFAATEEGRRAVHLLDRLVMACGRRAVISVEVEREFGGLDRFLDWDASYEDKAAAVDTIAARLLQSCLWWAQLTDEERDAFSDDDTLPYDLWRRENGEEGAAWQQ